ncbi:MAG: dephospho-CoA kinase [Alphaproteobacteria bacterium]|nr:dephospho-CoA kinase [Alphaproteobacteria bacterium]
MKPAIIGLTGSVGMGKSTAAAMLAAMGCAVHNADAAVARALSNPRGAAARKIARLFPAAFRRGKIDREKLRACVLGNAAALRRLERILHPPVRAAERTARTQARAQRKPALVLDIPLLFETKGEARCDAVIVVTASAAVQKKRVLARPGMDAARLRFIRARQMPDAEKRRRADFVVRSDRGRAAMRKQLKQALQKILEGHK